MILTLAMVALSLVLCGLGLRAYADSPAMVLAFSVIIAADTYLLLDMIW